MAMIAPDERLPCGVTLEALLMQVADGEPAGDPAHQRTCPYCQTALRRLEQGWADVKVLTLQPVAIPRGLTAMIMQRIRTLTGYLVDSILLGHRRGETRIRHTVVAKIIRDLAATVPGVVFASVELSPQQPPHPRRVNVAVRLIVNFGPAMERVADAVRLVLRRRIPPLTGAELDRIDITISDVVARSRSSNDASRSS
jgi:uncharacterized alkaline shock family protein YloU